MPTLASALATITVAADSDITCTFYNSHERGSIQVEKLIAGTTTRIDGATFALDADGNPATTDDQTPIPAVADETGLYCIDNLLFGSYNVIETAPPGGFTGDDSVEVVVVDSESTCAGRTADDVDASFENQAITAIVTQASGPVTVGATITDTATLSGGFNPTGTITFTAYSDAACTAGSVVFTDMPRSTATASTRSDPYITTFAGTIFWIASYSGDASNTAATGSCGDANESSVVEQGRAGRS